MKPLPAWGDTDALAASLSRRPMKKEPDYLSVKQASEVLGVHERTVWSFTEDGDDPIPTYRIKEQMGHSSIQVTVDHYARFMPGGNRGAVNKLDHVGMK